MSHAAQERVLSEARAEREAWDALLDEIGVASMTIPGVVGDWSAKDVLGHIAANLRYWGAQAYGLATGVPQSTRDLFGIDELPADLASFSLDQINARIQEQYAPLSVADVRACWNSAYDRLIEGVAGLSEDDLTTAGRRNWAFGQSIEDALAGSTYRHARAHAAELHAWLDAFDA